ncbi:MAG TPA: histidinol dehydrogenase [Pseudomonadales bacterium]|nr:histidinol dehydrogenase [Pseudomonadales bacterium]
MSQLTIPLLSTRLADFDTQLHVRLARQSEANDQLDNTVREIIAALRADGDEALLRLTAQFDQLTLSEASALEISRDERQAALESLPLEQRELLEAAAERIRFFHEKQKQHSWSYTEADGTQLGQLVRPMDRVGVYVPGGKAAYPSSVLMNIIPAKVAGVPEIIMVVPTPAGVRNELVIAAAEIAGADRIFTIGGAQAIAALAYGTATVPKVDKIVGPGNRYVAAAKKLVFGVVGIDMIAGPSEIMILADRSANPDWLAMDMFSQAEHDENAQCILVSADAELLQRVQASMQKQLSQMPRSATIKASLEGRGLLIHVRDREEGLAVINQVAPEHLELAITQPEDALNSIRHAGAIFMGHYSPEALGDYCAGPNHVLPTAGTARFSSPLGVYDFQKRSSLIYCSQQGAEYLAPIAARLAQGEGLDAHALSAQYRCST